MIKAIKGTNDILPEEINYWNYLTEKVMDKMRIWNYKEIRTPIFEHTALFSRSIGETTDIVSKEMYSFTDRSENNLTLKPEMTASVVRSYIEHSLGKKSGLNKLFYISPMFRQERPQAGRLRQFHQYGIEAIGTHSPIMDAEIIQVAYEILRDLGLNDIKVIINSLGLQDERVKFSNTLKNYLSAKKGGLSEDSLKRFETNVLRILDSKNLEDQDILNGAPSIHDFLGKESFEHFQEVQNLLTIAKIPFEIEHKLVRGLDYYTHTTFEIQSSKVGAQSALCGGGRYNLLVEQLGGSSTPGVGFAAGIERILLACRSENSFQPTSSDIDIYIVRIDEFLGKEAFQLATFFRKQNFIVELDYLSRSVKAQMREANRLNSRFVVLLGGKEYNNGELQIKNMNTGDQQLVKTSELHKIIEILKY